MDIIQKTHQYRTMSNRNVLAFAGRKRVGKSMLSKYLAHKYNGHVVTIASQLKKLSAELLDLTVDSLNRIKDDGTTFNVVANERWSELISERTGIELEKIEPFVNGVTFTSVRDVLQIIGTDVIRKFCPDWHINETIKEIDSYDDDALIIVDDVRFPNELEKLQEYGADVYFIVRPYNWDISNHMSETALNLLYFAPSKVVLNRRLPSDLCADIENIIRGKTENCDTLMNYYRGRILYDEPSSIKEILIDEGKRFIYGSLKKYANENGEIRVNCHQLIDILETGAVELGDFKRLPNDEWLLDDPWRYEIIKLCL